MLRRTAGAVVIGGGVQGLSSALHLARRGLKDVVLVEKRYLGSGATEWSNARLIPQHGTEEMIKVTNESLKTFCNFGDVIGGGGDPQCFHTGRIWSGPEERVTEFKSAAADHKKWGARLRFISNKEIKEMFTAEINVDDIAISVYYEDCYVCNPGATVSALARAAKQLGVSIYEDTLVTGIKVSRGEVSSVITNQGEIATTIVVNAAGLWSDRIGRMVGVDIPIKPIRVQVTLFEPPWDFSPQCPQLHDAVYEIVYGPERGGRLNIHDRYQVAEYTVVDPDTYSHDAAPEAVTMNVKMMFARFPSLARASFRGGATGAYDLTPDAAPIFGAVPEVGGFYLNCGWSGDGFMTSPVMGDLMAELILTGKTTLIDLSPFRLSRFKEGKLLVGPWYSPDNRAGQLMNQRRQSLKLPSNWQA